MNAHICIIIFHIYVFIFRCRDCLLTEVFFPQPLKSIWVWVHTVCDEHRGLDRRSGTPSHHAECRCTRSLTVRLLRKKVNKNQSIITRWLMISRMYISPMVSFDHLFNYCENPFTPTTTAKLHINAWVIIIWLYPAIYPSSITADYVKGHEEVTAADIWGNVRFTLYRSSGHHWANRML